MVLWGVIGYDARWGVMGYDGVRRVAMGCEGQRGIDVFKILIEID